VTLKVPPVTPVLSDTTDVVVAAVYVTEKFAPTAGDTVLKLPALALIVNDELRV
jgi:hypothetical protein